MLVLSDFTALFLAGALAYLAWARPVRQQGPGIYLDLVPLLVLFLFGYAQSGLYPGFGLGPVETLRRQTLVTAFGFVVLAAISFVTKLPSIYSRVAFALAFLLALFAVPLLRAAVSWLAGRWAWWPEPVVVVGTGRRAQQAIAALADRRLGYRAVGVLAAGDEPPEPVKGVPFLGTLECAADVAAWGVDVALVETESLPRGRVLDRLQQHFPHVVVLRAYDELPVEGVQVRNLGAFLGIEYTNNLLRQRNRWLKRGLDIALGGATLVFTTPVVVLSVLAVKLASRGPAFYTQERAGLDGRPVRVPKIRTMRADAEKRLEAYLAANPGLRQEWDEHMKLRDDPRLIPVLGRFLRMFSLDELPQLWSVVKGEMSLVGPRPFPDYHLVKFTREFRDLRQRVRPGISGMWQITVRSAGGIEDQEAHDTYYIRNWSVWLDIYILARTARAVLSGRGAY